MNRCNKENSPSIQIISQYFSQSILIGMSIYSHHSENFLDAPA